MSAPVDLGEVHSRLTDHLADIDRIRESIVTTLALVSGEPHDDWTLGQLRELWMWIRGRHLVLEVLSQVALRPGEWVAFRDIIPNEADQPQARNELGALTRAVRRQRGEPVPLYERAQNVHTNYHQAYRMEPGVAALVVQILEEETP